MSQSLIFFDDISDPAENVSSPKQRDVYQRQAENVPLFTDLFQGKFY